MCLEFRRVLFRSPTPLVVVQLLGELDDAPGACALHEEVPVVVQGGTLADEDRQEGLHRSEAPVGVVRVRHPDLTDLILLQGHLGAVRATVDVAREELGGEIGRAACRERVWTYGWDWVVGVSFKE